MTDIERLETRIEELRDDLNGLQQFVVMHNATVQTAATDLSTRVSTAATCPTSSRRRAHSTRS